MRTRKISYHSKDDNGAIVTTSTTIVLASTTNYENLEAFAVNVLNAGAANLSAFSVDVSPDGTNWIVQDDSTLATLAAGAISRITVNPNVGKYYKASAKVASGTTTLDVWVDGR